MEKEYKKTYLPLILWIILYTVIIVATVLILDKYIILTNKTLTDITCIITIISLDILFYIMYRGEYAYWMNGGPNFEKAKEAGSKARKGYLLAHLKVFIKMTILCFLYLIASYIFKISYWIDFIVFLIAVIIAVFVTIPIKLENYTKADNRKEDKNG